MKKILSVVMVCIAIVAASAQYGEGPGITVYEHGSFGGKSQVIKSDWTASADWNDLISSIRIPRGYKIQVFEHGNFGGRSLTLTGDWDMSNNPDFNDLITCIRIVERPSRGGGMGIVKDMVCCGQNLGKIESPNKMYYLVFQETDKNLVLYTRDGKPLWASNTGGLAATSCVMQQDGNLVIYNGSAPIWSTNTYGNAGAKLHVQNDGNLVIYRADGKSIWSSNTAQAAMVPTVPDMVCCGQTLGKIESPSKMYYLVFQETDKNLVVYTRDGKPLWASNTGGLAATTCVMQQDGNLVIYNGSAPIWSSNTYGNNGAKLIMQDDGNLVIYRAGDNAAIWQSNTSQTVVVAPVQMTQAVVADSPCSMPEQQFNGAVKAIEAQAFRDGKMAMAKQAIKNKCVSLGQIRTIAKLFSFEDQTLEFLKYAYDFTNEKSEYYTLSDIFSFNSNTESFTKFLESK